MHHAGMHGDITHDDKTYQKYTETLLALVKWLLQCLTMRGVNKILFNCQRTIGRTNNFTLEVIRTKVAANKASGAINI
jgi:hypothetical protein